MPDPITSRAPDKPPTIAVLAFENYSNDPDLAYFADGVSEEILQTVARTTDLKVIGRASSFQFRGAAKAAKHVAAQLGATHLLDGSVRRSGARVRITAQLVDCASGTSVWSDRFDRDLSDVFALQDEIAAAVAAALKAAFTPTPAIIAIDPKAYDLYLRARSLAADLDTRARAELLEQAVALAPDFAAAWAALCHARATQAYFGPWTTTPRAQLRQGAQAAADKALALNPAAGLAYASLSRLEPLGAYARREALLRQAEAAAPDDPETLTSVGAFYNHVGFIRQAHGYLARACELDPLYPEAANVLGAILASLDRVDEVRAHFAACRQTWPNEPIFHIGSLNRAMLTGDWPTFNALAEVARAALGDEQGLRATLRVGEALRDGDPTFRDRLAARLKSDIQATGAAPLHSLLTASAIGMTEAAFAAIEASDYSAVFRTDGQNLAGLYNPGIIFTPTYSRALMADVRFVGLCAKLGLCRYWAAADRWPDCATSPTLSYDFKSEARRLAQTDAFQQG